MTRHRFPSSKPMPTGHHLPKSVSRRDVLGWGLAGAGLSALGPLGKFIPEARGAPAGQKFVVVIFLYGGHDGTNAVIPTSLPSYYSRRPAIAIPAVDQLSLNSGPNPTTTNALHPRLVNLQRMWEAGDAAFVNLVGYPTHNLSHFVSQDVYSLGVRGAFADLGLDESGWIARYADLYAPTPMGAVSVGVGRPLDFVGGTSNPLLVSSLNSFQFYGYGNQHLHSLEALREVLDGYSGTGLEGEAGAAIEQSHALSDQIQAAVAGYTGTGDYFLEDYRNVPPDPTPTQRSYNIHYYMKDIARLIQHGFETRVFFTGFGGFDTHSNQGTNTQGDRHPDLMERLDTAIAAFETDMKLFGCWDDTLIVVTSEFGRRNFENGSEGTDHGGGSCVMLAGGAVNGGMYGPDLTEADLATNWLGYDVDFRDIYREIINDHLGADPGPVFPEPQEKNTVLGIA